MVKNDKPEIELMFCVIIGIFLGILLINLMK